MQKAAGGHSRGSRDPETLSRSRSVSKRILRLEELGHAEGAESPSDQRLARIPAKGNLALNVDGLLLPFQFPHLFIGKGAQPSVP